MASTCISLNECRQITIGVTDGNSVVYIRDKNNVIRNPNKISEIIKIDTALIWSDLGAENISYTFEREVYVKYGAGSTWVYKWLSPGTYILGNDLFGDPIQGTPKRTYLAT